MKTITFNLKGCPGTTPAPISIPEIQCVAVDEVKAAEVRSGGRTVLVTPHGDTGICSGQYGQWQVLTGFGGQINRGMYCGDSFTKEDGFSSPGVSSTVDCEDTVEKGTKCLAIRDRGRWFVFCPKGSGSSSTGAAIAVGFVLGGNVQLSSLPPADDIELKDPVLRAVYPVPDTTENEYGFLDSDYPQRRPFGYTLPELDLTGSALALPIVNDWRKYDLPAGYSIGDVLPRLPDGLCYVRVERPFVLSGGETWEAGNLGPPPRPSVGPQIYVKAVLEDVTVKIWLRYAVDGGSPAGAPPGTTWELVSPAPATPADVRALFTVTSEGSSVAIGTYVLGAGAVSLDSNGFLTVTLYKFKDGFASIPVTTGELSGITTLTIAVVAGVVVSTYQGQPVPAASLAVVTGDIREGVVVALNDVSRQGFRAGDLVHLIDVAIQYEDRYGLVSPDGNQTRRVYRILSGSSGVKRNITSV